MAREITKLEEIQRKGQALRLEIENRHGSSWFMSHEPERYCAYCGHKGLWQTDSDTYQGDLLECAKCGWTFWLNEQALTDRYHPSAVAVRAAERYAAKRKNGK